MPSHARFHLQTVSQLKAEMERQGIVLPLSDQVQVLGDAVTIGARWTAPNRFAVHPMEGFDALPDGSPQELSFRRYRRYAAGGAGLIWFEATAVLNEARSNPRQLYLHKGNMDVYRRLVAATREAGRKAFGRPPVLVIQLTHSGRYSKPAGVPAPIIAHHSPILDPKHNLPPDYPLVTDDYLDRLQDTFVEAAQLAAAAGFDGVDIKSCHRYLLSELLASFTREHSRYGGAFENRTRLLRETLMRIAAEVPGVFLSTRLNAYDAISHPYGFGVSRDSHHVPDLAEPLQLVKDLRAIDLALLNISIGNPYFNPHYGRPFDFPIKGMQPPDEHPLQGIARFLDITRVIQQANPDLPVVGAGYSWLRHLIPYVAAGVVKTGGATFIGQGRNSFAYPDSVKDVLATGRMDPAKCCVTCSACTQIMRDADFTGCVVRDSEIYGASYRNGRRFSLDHLQEQARRCRACEEPTCSRGCPAHIRIPAFIRAFADGDFATAYDVLRASNALPEMCAFVCPSEEQCEKGCLETVFSRCPIPIRDIQLAVSRIARQRQLTGVRLPEPSGRTAAVVGGGPAGVACAIRLLELGHAVVLFEKRGSLGGTPHAIIPHHRYRGAAEEIQSILEPALKAGRIRIQTGQTLGTDLSLADLKKQYDAIFLALGLSRSTSLGRVPGVVDALDFLREVKTGKITAVPGKVAVLGAGNTAMDAAMAVKHLGASDVYMVYRRSFAEMPAWPAERDAFLAAGGHLLVLTQPLGYATGPDGRVAGVKVVRTELGAPDESGRRRPVPVKGSESILPVDLAIEAMGQYLDDTLKTALQDLAFSADGLLKVKDGGNATSNPKVFAGGDLVNGGTTAVQGVAEGMRAADEIDGLLRRS